MNIFKKQLEEIKNNIAVRRYSILSFSEKKKDLSSEIREIETALKDKIAAMIDDKGKALFSNQAKRDSAFKEMIKDDQDYESKKQLLEQLDYRMRVLDIEIEQYKYEFKIEEIVSRNV